MLFIFFFFQAEDGIRDRNVTGVQTCALPISAVAAADDQIRQAVADWDGDGLADLIVGCGDGSVIFYRNIGTAKEPRSEERRVGKECRSREWADRLKEK